MAVNKGGVFLAIVCLALGATVLTLATVEFRTLYATWSDHRTYTALGPTQITAGVLMVVSSILAFPSLTTPNPGLKMIGGIFVLISFLFCYAIGIFAAVGAAMKGNISKAIGCHTENTGLLNIWQNIDEYFILANSLVCSPLCPCNITYDQYARFTNDRFISKYMDEFDEGDYVFTDKGKFNIKNCPSESKKYIERMFENNPNNTFRDINFEKFRKYFKYIENSFQCTGWCTTKYINVFNLKPQHMFKYIFNNLNEAVPKYPGCLNRVLYFVYVITAINASFLLLCAVLQTILFLIIISRKDTVYEHDPKAEEVDPAEQ